MDLKKYRQSVTKLAESMGIISFQEELTGLDAFLPLLEKMRLEGAIILLKLDGERGKGDTGPYTALVSGKMLNGDFFRIDADSMENALAYVVVHYARHQWNFTE
jgi:hypothetical protein